MPQNVRDGFKATERPGFATDPSRFADRIAYEHAQNLQLGALLTIPGFSLALVGLGSPLLLAAGAVLLGVGLGFEIAGKALEARSNFTCNCGSCSKCAPLD